jgi:hypothetical protein
MAVVRCQCGKKWKLPENSAGKTIACPACQANLPIPTSPKPAVAKNEEQSTAEKCPSCGGALPAAAVICVQCGFDRRTGKRAGKAARASEAKPAGYPRIGLALVYWGSRLGFGIVAAGLGLALVLIGLFGEPGADRKDNIRMVVLGVIFAGIGMQVGSKGSRIDWSRDSEEDLDFEQLLLARGAPALSGLLVIGAWLLNSFEELFGFVLPMGLFLCTGAVVVGLILCFAASSPGAQKTWALASAGAYLAAPVFLLLTVFHSLAAALAIFSAGMGEVFLLLWLRELGRQMKFGAVVAHVRRLLLFVAAGSVVLALPALLLSRSIQATLQYPPIFSVGAFVFYLCGVLFAAAATMWRLHNMGAILDEIEFSQQKPDT